MNQKRSVLFLCVGNSCRSQLAEAIVNSRLAGWQAVSAGVRPTGTIHPMTLRVLNEIGIQHNGRSKSADMFRGRDFDLVVTVCDAANQECPVWLGTGRKAHLSFADPAAVSGSEEERLLAFRRVRDEIALRIPELLSAQVP